MSKLRGGEERSGNYIRYVTYIIAREALRIAQELFRDDTLAGRVPQGWIEVEDEERRSVMLVPVSPGVS